jgi:hypothetical protein
VSKASNDRQLADILAALYPDVNTAVTIARRVEIEPSGLDQSGSAQDVWGRVVREARARKQTIRLIDEARADTDTEELRNLKINELGETDRNRAMYDVGDALAGHIDRLREEMRGMEDRLGQRIDQVDAKVEQLKAVSLMYTGKKRTAWLIGVLLFCLPCFLFLDEVRQVLDLATPAAVIFVTSIWTVAAGFSLYGLGYLRDL